MSCRRIFRASGVRIAQEFFLGGLPLIANVGFNTVALRFDVEKWVLTIELNCGKAINSIAGDITSKVIVVKRFDEGHLSFSHVAVLFLNNHKGAFQVVFMGECGLIGQTGWVILGATFDPFAD